MTDENGVKDPSRRNLLSAFAIGGAAVAGGVVGGVAGTALVSNGTRRESLSIDVACIGDTWTDSLTRDPLDEADFRVPFLVEGWMYPAATIPAVGFVPTEEGSIGRWFCRGWVIINSAREEPHVASNQDYFFGTITHDDLFPQDMLSSSGIEGTLTDQRATRAVIGGGGQYAGATGSVTQRGNGENTTILRDGGDFPAPNFTFDFDIWVPEA